MRYLSPVLVLVLFAAPGKAQSTPQHPLPSRPGADVRSSVSIVAANEPGEPLIIDGEVFAPDGTTPVPGMFVHAYNTDAQGHYAADGRFYPPRLQGWVRTDAQGRFRVRTIRPGHYPNAHIPAHVHFGLWGAGYPFQYVDELRFAGDPYLTADDLDRAKADGRFATVVSIQKGESGTWHARCNLRASKTSNFPGVLPDYYK